MPRPTKTQQGLYWVMIPGQTLCADLSARSMMKQIRPSGSVTKLLAQTKSSFGGAYNSETLNGPTVANSYKPPPTTFIFLTQCGLWASDFGMSQGLLSVPSRLLHFQQAIQVSHHVQKAVSPLLDTERTFKDYIKSADSACGLKRKRRNFH